LLIGGKCLGQVALGFQNVSSVTVTDRQIPLPTCVARVFRGQAFQGFLEVLERRESFSQFSLGLESLANFSEAHCKIALPTRVIRILLCQAFPDFE
jgi:hypothetical protein